MSIPELILRLAFASFGVVIILALLLAELQLRENSLDDTVWVVCGVIAGLFVLAALFGPGAFAQLFAP